MVRKYCAAVAVGIVIFIRVTSDVAAQDIKLSTRPVCSWNRRDIAYLGRSTKGQFKGIVKSVTTSNGSWTRQPWYGSEDVHFVLAVASYGNTATLMPTRDSWLLAPVANAAHLPLSPCSHAGKL